MLDTSAQERLILEVLDPGETIEIRAAAADALLAVTDRRLAPAFEVRLALAIPFESLRRIEFDFERARARRH